MMIKNTTSVGGVEPAASKPQTEATAPRRQADRVSTGSYAPSASELADRLVSAAEIDARLQAMLGG